MQQFEVKVNYITQQGETTVTKHGLFVVPAETKQQAVELLLNSEAVRSLLNRTNGTLVSIE